MKCSLRYVAAVSAVVVVAITDATTTAIAVEMMLMNITHTRQGGWINNLRC